MGTRRVSLGTWWARTDCTNRGGAEHGQEGESPEDVRQHEEVDEW
ncbi:hypothetical protein Q604_UNBC07578G0001, partial [human gut metagenome]